MTQPLSPDSALKAAVDRIGSQGRMARLCGVKQPSVWRWVHKMGELPAQHVLKVEEATGISRHDLRPDIYPVETDTALTLAGASGAGPVAASSRRPAGHSGNHGALSGEAA